MTSVLWFRRDLRLTDLPALGAAMEAGPVAPLFVFDDRLLAGRWQSPNRNAFLLECVRGLDAALNVRGSRLHLRHGDPRVVVPSFAAECAAKAVFASRDYTPFARRRDDAVSEALSSRGVALHLCPGTLVHEPEEVLTGAGQPYSVYGPFFRNWSTLPRRMLLLAPPVIETVEGLEAGTFPRSFASLSDDATSPERLHGGETAAQQRLEGWTAGIQGYADGRDRMDKDATSRLSQDLKFGTLSPGQVIAAMESTEAESGKYIAEVAWRDFYHHVLWHNPRVLDQPFQANFLNLMWDNDGEHLRRWKDGRTGFPVVDAAMRQLLVTGYMHNRARMVVASFLTKDLHIDWRAGQAHFMRYLVDGDVANNNGGWQWAASTGTDAQPYFRIFNPVLQSKRFDPEGEYIRRWVPELRGVPDSHIHEPHRMTPEEQTAAGCIVGEDYPAPIVEHALERRVALERYSAAKASGSGQ